MSIFTVLTKFDHNFFKMRPISMKLCQTLRLHLMGGRLMSKKRGETASFGAKKLCAFRNKFPPLAPTTITKKPPIHISIVINSMKSLGMNTIFL